MWYGRNEVVDCERLAIYSEMQCDSFRGALEEMALC